MNIETHVRIYLYHNPIMSRNVDRLNELPGNVFLGLPSFREASQHIIPAPRTYILEEGTKYSPLS